MNRFGRTRIGLALALVACLLGLAWWLRPHEVPSPAPPAAAPHPQEQPALTVEPLEPAPDVAPTKPLSAFGTLRGRVIDAATREPVREFELRFAEWGRSAPDQNVPAAQKFRSKDGRFEWPRLPPGQWGLIAEAAGYQRFLADLRVVEGQTTRELLIPLVRGHVVRGRVYDAVTGTGIASAFISFRESGQQLYEGNWRMRPTTRSQKDGAFVLNGIPPGRITVEVGANNYATREVEVAVNDDTAPLEIGLSTGGLIAGRLAGPDGATPVAGSAGLYRMDSNVSGYEARTSDAGEFSFRNLAPGIYRLTGRGPGGSATREFVVSESERIEGVILTLRGGPTIRGTVTGLRPGELKALSIEAHRSDSEGLAGTPASINALAEYELRDVQPGRVTVTADVSNRRQLSRTIDVPAGADVTLDLDFPRGARVSGRVTQRGRPVAGVLLEPRPVVEGDVFSYGASTSQTGHYVIEDLAPGEYTIRIQGFKSRPFQVSGDTVFDIDVSPQLGGRVLEETGDVPIVGADVIVWPADPKSSQSQAFDHSDTLGRFAVAGLEPADFILTVYKPGYEMFRERISYTSPVGMTIRLGRDAGVEVRAHDAASGQPLPMKLFATETLGSRRGVTVPVPLDERGMGHIPSALTGATLAFWSEGYASQTVSGWNGDRLDLKFAREQR